MLAKKKQLLTATLLIALVAAVAVNWYYTRPGIADQSETASQTESSVQNLGDTVLVAGTVENASQVTGETQTDETLSQLESEKSEAYFSEAKLKRTNMHDSVINEIEKLISSENLSQQDKSGVNDMLLAFKNSLQSETDSENLIKAKVGGECLVVINDGSAQVVLEKGLLNDTVLLQITEIIEKNTNISAENLTIIETK